MEDHDGTNEDPGSIPHVPHTPHPPPEHRHEFPPISQDYNLVVRTVLWVIVGLVVVGLVIWWSLT
jgi:hypothetical protein